MDAYVYMLDKQDRKGKICFVCNETRSVKYEHDGKYYCNRCALPVMDKVLKYRSSQEFKDLLAQDN